MKIDSKDTVESVMLENAAVFNLANNAIYEQLKDRECPKYVPMRLKFGIRDRKIRARSVREITMQELDTLQNTLSGYKYFEKALAVMLSIDEADVKNLRFLWAYRYFIEILKELKDTANKWKSLKLPPTKEERAAKVKRTPIGIFGICQSYAEAMGGGPKGVHDAWETPWVEIFSYMQQKYYDALEQRRMIENSRKSQSNGHR